MPGRNMKKKTKDKRIPVRGRQQSRFRTGIFGRSYFRYWSIQFKISVIRSILFSGFPPRESSWFSPWKRQSLEGQPFLITALYMASPSAI